MFLHVTSVDLLHEVQLGALVLARDVLGAREIQNRRAGGTEQRALITCRQKAGTPIERSAFYAVAVSQHHVTGQVLAFAAQPISDPRARAGKARSSDAGVDLVKRRDVIVRFAVERLDKSK